MPVWAASAWRRTGVQLHPADNYNGAVPVVTYVLTDGSSTNASTLSISVTPVTDDFSDNDEQVTIDEDSARRLATSLMACRSMAGTVQLQHRGSDRSICAGSGIHHCRCGSFSLAANGATASPRRTTTTAGAGGHLCAD
ncbi:hypothetical protein FKF78_11790 [Aeromonas hydrophila]|nr:hypothetical protein [Aeromonas hydrophila]